jgi:uncharacterized protein (TIGR01244 family)
MKRLDEKVSVSGQIRPEEMTKLASDGTRMIVNNRPDDEEAEQPAAAEIAAAAQAAGLAYRHIPVGSGGLSANQVKAMAEALEAADGPVLAFCRSGTRSTYLWALAEARRGVPAQELIAKAAAAGYDLTSIRPFLG